MGEGENMLDIVLRIILWIVGNHVSENEHGIRRGDVKKANDFFRLIFVKKFGCIVLRPKFWNILVEAYSAVWLS